MTGPRQRLDELDAAREAATPGPWFFNSYSAVMSSPRLGEYNDAESLIPEDAPDEAYDGLPEFVVARVPVAGGDTATRQGATDAALIVAAVNHLPALVSALRAVADLADELEAEARRHDDAEPVTTQDLHRMILAAKHCRAHARDLRAALAPLAAPNTGDETTPSPTTEKASTPR